MKRTLIKAGLLATIGLAFVGVTMGTLSWFSNLVVIDNTHSTNTKIEGSTMGAYFAYGDGVPSTEAGDGHRVYGITKPRHLYNLAWLQYLGYFDRTDSSKKDYGTQFYFELAEDLDMTGWVLPPIGTESHPFIGNFEGNGHVISNLNVSNDFGDYNTHPTDVTSSNFNQPHIVGLFGVIGNYNNKYDTSNANCVFTSSANEFKDTGLSGITVRTAVKDSLIGLAAGYVDGVMSNVAVDTGTVDVANGVTINGGTTPYGSFTNISDYTLVGYTTKKTSIKKVSDTIYNVAIQTGQEFNANAQGSGTQGWGGSIDMKSMFQRLDNIRKNATATTTTYTYRTTRTYNANGSQNGSDTNTNYTSGKIYTGTGTNATIGNFNYLNPNDSFMYMAGGRYVIDKYYSYYNHNGYVITNGTRYLNNNNGSIQSGTSLADATRWIFTIGSSTISTQYNGTTYYLRDNNGTLAITTTAGNATTWTIESSNNKFIIYDASYYLNISGTNWTLTATPGLKIKSGTHYLNYNGSLGNTDTEGSASGWKYSTGSSTITTTYNNTTYYLRNNNGTLTTTTNSNNATTWTISIIDNKLDIYNGNYHLTYNSGWKLVQDTGSIYYTIRDGSNHYIGPYGGSGYATSTTQANASKLSYGLSTATNSSGQYGFYYTSGSTNYYYGFYSTGTYAVQVYNDSRALFHMVGDILPDANNPSITGKMYATYNGTTYYVKYNGNNPPWTVDTTMSNGSDMTITYNDTRTFSPNIDITTSSISSIVNSVDSSTKEGPDNYLDNSRQNEYREYTAANTTYFPLNVSSDGGTSSSSITNGDYRPTDGNTGYVIAGSTLTDSNTISNGGPSLIRVSSYAVSNIQNSYSNSTITDSKVRTITASGDKPITEAYSNLNTDLEKYSSSKTTLLSVLSGSSNIYGLHFMNSQISSNDIVKATNVSILGNSYGNPNDSNTKKRTYDLPVNSIDFNLKEKGFINFFAGTYFSSDVTSFFSLHQIFRDSEANGYAITEIKEIAEIYGNNAHKNWSYAYKYTDGTYSKPFRFTGINDKYELTTVTPDPNTIYSESHNLSSSEFATYTGTYGYTKLFDTEWITNYTHSAHSQIKTLNQKYLYYFEIPMNSGEFCLGSVYGGTGGYLLYLDIGASAAKTQRTVVAEHFLEVMYTFSHPDGVALIPTSTIEGNSPTFDDKNSVCVMIQSTYQGLLEVTRDDSNNVTVTREANYTSVAKPSYISDTIVSVVDPGANSESTSDDTDLMNAFSYEAKSEKETYRIQYYDYNVNFGSLTKTIIEDVRTRTNDGSWSDLTRTVTQQVDNGNVLTLTSESQITNATISIFKYLGANNQSNGTKWTYSEITNLSSQIYFNGSTNVTSATICSTLNTEIAEIYHLLEGNNTADITIILEMIVDENITTGNYYAYGQYIFIPVASGGDIDFIVKDISTNKVYFIDGNSVLENGTFVYVLADDGIQLTAEDQTVTAHKP